MEPRRREEKRQTERVRRSFWIVSKNNCQIKVWGAEQRTLQGEETGSFPCWKGSIKNKIIHSLWNSLKSTKIPPKNCVSGVPCGLRSHSYSHQMHLPFCDLLFIFHDKKKGKVSHQIYVLHHIRQYLLDQSDSVKHRQIHLLLLTSFTCP